MFSVLVVLQGFVQFWLVLVCSNDYKGVFWWVLVGSGMFWWVREIYRNFPSAGPQNGRPAARAKKLVFEKGHEMIYIKKNPFPRTPKWPASRQREKSSLLGKEIKQITPELTRTNGSAGEGEVLTSEPPAGMVAAAATYPAGMPPPETLSVSGGFWCVLVGSGGFWLFSEGSGEFWWILVNSGCFWWALVYSGGFW